MANPHRSAKDRARERIQGAMVLDRLLKAFEGEIELTSVQANIGLKMLNKLVPDLKAVEMDSRESVTHSVDGQSVEQAVGKVIAAINAARSADT